MWANVLWHMLLFSHMECTESSYFSSDTQQNSFLGHPQFVRSSEIPDHSYCSVDIAFHKGHITHRNTHECITITRTVRVHDGALESSLQPENLPPSIEQVRSPPWIRVLGEDSLRDRQCVVIVHMISPYQVYWSCKSKYSTLLSECFHNPFQIVFWSLASNFVGNNLSLYELGGKFQGFIGPLAHYSRHTRGSHLRIREPLGFQCKHLYYPQQVKSFNPFQLIMIVQTLTMWRT